MGIEPRTLCRSSNGSRWRPARATGAGRVFIRRDANPSSGGRALLASLSLGRPRCTVAAAWR